MSQSTVTYGALTSFLFCCLAPLSSFFLSCLLLVLPCLFCLAALGVGVRVSLLVKVMLGDHYQVLGLSRIAMAMLAQAASVWDKQLKSTSVLLHGSGASGTLIQALQICVESLSLLATNSE